MSLRDISSAGRWSAPLLALCLGVFVAGCDSLIDVENPNNVLDEDIRKPEGAASVANGALYTVEDGYDFMLVPYTVLGDEGHWIGSRDAWRELDFGIPTDINNEFIDGAFDNFAQGRWMADEAVKILEGLDADGELGERDLLAEAYLWAAISYTAIADWMDDFALSDRKEAGPAIGAANMSSFYDTALGYLTSGLAIASTGDLGRNLTAMKARTQHAKAVWNMIGSFPNPGGPSNLAATLPNGGLVMDAGAAADAAAALALDGTDWVFQFEYTSATLASDLGFQFNERLEHRIGDLWINPTADDKEVESVKMTDPIDGVPDPRLEDFVDTFAGDDFLDITILSGRLMHLIIAEDALARGTPADMTTFASSINTVRGWGGVTGTWSAASAITADSILRHERGVNLFMQGVRVHDLYRFGMRSDNWQTTSPAVQTPGTFFPITIIEIRSNCHLNQDFEC
ncbi:MAG: RagB/SusD family nutrient uptake outer membrane protein [Planctomycetota bacterium]|jgi:hypothetical protein